jgi:hypothetical protein
LAGLYQLNITIPSTGVTAGDNALNVSGPDAYTSVCLIPIGNGTSTTSLPGVAMRKRPGAAAKHIAPMRHDRTPQTIR